jgi:hypothetical protein
VSGRAPTRATGAASCPGHAHSDVPGGSAPLRQTAAAPWQAAWRSGGCAGLAAGLPQHGRQATPSITCCPEFRSKRAWAQGEASSASGSRRVFFVLFCFCFFFFFFEETLWRSWGAHEHRGHYGKAGRPVHPVSLPKWEACRSAATVRANTEIGGGGNISAVCLSLLPLTVPFGSYYSGEPPTDVY